MTTLTPIHFFSDEIVLVPHTATSADHIGRPVSIREFAGELPVALYRVDNGEYLVRAGRPRHIVKFMEGPELEVAES